MRLQSAQRELESKLSQAVQEVSAHAAASGKRCKDRQTLAHSSCAVLTPGIAVQSIRKYTDGTAAACLKAVLVGQQYPVPGRHQCSGLLNCVCSA
jgi:hypothetical protein